jgi:hypothetical protein
MGALVTVCPPACRQASCVWLGYPELRSYRLQGDVKGVTTNGKEQVNVHWWGHPNPTWARHRGEKGHALRG